MTGPDPSPPTDLQLVAAYQAGDQRAAARLVERHAEAVIRYLAAAGADPPDVDDLLQETLFRGFRRIATWRGGISLRSWLVAIAANLLRDARRRGRGRTILPLEEATLPTHPPADAAAESADLEERVRRGIGRLPRMQGEVFLRRAQLGEGYDEIARALQTTPGAARVHYHHAVKRLKELLR